MSFYFSTYGIQELNQIICGALLFIYFSCTNSEDLFSVSSRVSLKYISGAEEDHSGRESSNQGLSSETTLDASSQIAFFHLLFSTLESYTFLYLYRELR